MIEFQTTRGNKYCYSTTNNHIYPGGQLLDVEEFEVEFEMAESYSLNKISTFTIEVTQECNLRCRYCCYSGEYKNRRSHQSIELSDENLSKCIEFIVNNMDRDSPYITLCFYGGEALLAKQKIERIIKLLQSKYSNTEFLFSISSNGLLLNESNIEWICNTPNLQVVVTIDGDKVMHDKNRVTSSGQGSFDIILQNLTRFQKLYPELYLQKVQFISTVRSISDVIRLNSFWMNNELLKDNRPKHISSLIPNFSKGESISPKTSPFELFFQAAFESYINNKDNILTDELQRYINIIKYRTLNCIPSKQRFITCLHEPYSCFITANGKLYVCERFCQEHYIGDLNRGIDRQRCIELNKSFTNRKGTYCSNCWAKRLCRICATNLNNTDEQFCQYCNTERTQLKLALQYYCEILEHDKYQNLRND